MPLPLTFLRTEDAGRGFAPTDQAVAIVGVFCERPRANTVRPYCRYIALPLQSRKFFPECVKYLDWMGKIFYNITDYGYF